MVVIYDLQEHEGHETYKFEVFWQGKPLGERALGADGPAPESLLAWMYENGISDGIVIAPGELALWLRFDIEEVLARRSDAAFHAELKEHLQSFKKPKVAPKTVQQVIAEAFANGLRPDPKGDS